MTKSIITSAKAIIVLLAVISFSNFAIAAKGTEKIVIKTTIHCDHCTVCESCAPWLNKELKYITGVKFASLDVKAMTFTIEYNSAKTTPAKIRTAISKLGYDADDVKADATAYSKLDGCCKKK